MLTAKWTSPGHDACVNCTVVTRRPVTTIQINRILCAFEADDAQVIGLYFEIIWTFDLRIEARRVGYWLIPKLVRTHASTRRPFRRLGAFDIFGLAKSCTRYGTFSDNVILAEDDE